MTEGRICESNGRPTGQRVRYDRTKGEPPSIAVATALAEYHQEDVLGCRVPLYEYVDPEALDAFFENTRSDDVSERNRSVRHVEFFVDDAVVSIDPDSIVISPLE